MFVWKDENKNKKEAGIGTHKKQKFDNALAYASDKATK